MGTESEDRSGYAPFDHTLGITERYSPACGYFLDLFTVRGAYQENLDHFHEIFRSDGVEYISLLEAEQIMRSHGAGLEAIEQERISAVYDKNGPGDIEKHEPIDGTMIIAMDATKIRHRDGEKSIEIKGNNREINHYGFKDAKIALIGAVGESPDNHEPRTENMTYVAAIEPIEEFIKRVYTEMTRRSGTVTRKVFIGDGADWILGRVDELIDYDENVEVIKILDFYHPKERFVTLAKELFGENTLEYHAKKEKWTSDVYFGNLASVLNDLRRLRKCYRGNQRKIIDTDIRYFEARKDYMRYDIFRSMGLPIGSGAIESACGHVIGGRLKGGGMTWAEAGADSILTARCSFKNGTFFEDYKKLIDCKNEQNVA